MCLKVVPWRPNLWVRDYSPAKMFWTQVAAQRSRLSVAFNLKCEDWLAGERRTRGRLRAAHAASMDAPRSGSVEKGLADVSIDCFHINELGALPRVDCRIDGSMDTFLYPLLGNAPYRAHPASVRPLIRSSPHLLNLSLRVRL
jgi:hypothetical protein